MMGFLRFSLLLVMLLGSHTIHVRADVETLSDAPPARHELFYESSLVGRAATLQLLEGAGPPSNEAVLRWWTARRGGTISTCVPL